MKVLISKFFNDENTDLTHFSGSRMQIAFFQRKVFKDFDHPLFARRLEEAQIKVESVHAPAADVYHQANNEFMHMLEVIRSVYKVNVITLHPQRGERRQAKTYYKKLEKEIENMGIILAYETFEEEAVSRKWISQIEDMHTYFDALKLPFLKVTYDFTHSAYEKSLNEVRNYNDKIEVIHLSDALKDRPLDMNEYHQHLPLGYGNYKVIEFLDLLLEIDYKSFIVLEYHPEYDHLLKGDARLLKEYISGNKPPLRELVAARHKMKHSRIKVN